MIKAPYNFVPVSDTVVRPEWASLISHDVPFSDGVSGTITVQLTTKSPIFVRNGYSKDEGKNKTGRYQSFCHDENGNYFIPATTVKGAIRNILEIMSFGKMRMDRNMGFAQREWYNKVLYTLKTKQAELQCGWLRMRGDGNGYEIVDCGTPYRLSHNQIDKWLGKNLLSGYFCRTSSFNINKPYMFNGVEYDPKTSVFKYKIIEDCLQKRGRTLAVLEQQRFSRVPQKSYGKTRVDFDLKGPIRGTIVFTGQPDKWGTKPRRIGDGKYYEFVFGEESNRVYPITETEFNRYKFIYSDSADWKFMTETFLSGKGIPVFFRTEKGKIKDWGLAFMYKLPYERTPMECLPDAHKSNGYDFAECIFGAIGDQSSLRGRVQFSHFNLNLQPNTTVIEDKKGITLALGSPKASYYPIYINQSDGRGGFTKYYKTYNDGGLKGWKRYLNRQSVWGAGAKDEVCTRIYPLTSSNLNCGLVFEGKVRFHNLKPEELGALLSALTFHDNQNGACHQIGAAKPYGYGRVAVTKITLDTNLVGGCDEVPKTARGYMEDFEGYMNSRLGKTKWCESPQIKELITLACKQVSTGQSQNYEYMKLGMKQADNEFNNAKKAKEYLQYYSELVGNASVKSLTDNISS